MGFFDLDADYTDSIHRNSYRMKFLLPITVAGVPQQNQPLSNSDLKFLFRFVVVAVVFPFRFSNLILI